MKMGASMRAVGSLAILLVGCGAVSAAGPKPRVSIEILTRPNLPLTASQQWYKVLTEAGIDGLQIRAGNGREQVSIAEQGTSRAPEYRVVGILAADNSLHLPGGKFAVGDVGRLRKWLDNLGDQGADGVTQPRSAFGLVAKQLEQVHDDLKKPVEFSTQGIAAAKAVREVGRQLKYTLLVDETAKGALADTKVVDELQGVSSGTALAAMLRPAGLVLEPVRPPGEELRYRIGKAVAGRESWPIGWKPAAAANKTLPDLFEFLNVEIKEIPVAEALEAIQSRLKVPFLCDHNAMALHSVDLAGVEADVPSKRLTYSLVLNKILMQARAKYELRVDEAEKPFVWITTVKPVR